MIFYSILVALRDVAVVSIYTYCGEFKENNCIENIGSKWRSTEITANSIIPFYRTNEVRKIKESSTSAQRNDNCAVQNKCNFKINELAGHVLRQFEISFRNSIRIFFKLKRLIVYPSWSIVRSDGV